MAADILGKSGRDMLDALVAGETVRDVLAELARKQMRKKIPALREALTGHFDSHHRLWIGAILRHIDFVDEQIERLTVMIEQQIRPFAPALPRELRARFASDAIKPGAGAARSGRPSRGIVAGPRTRSGKCPT